MVTCILPIRPVAVHNGTRPQRINRSRWDRFGMMQLRLPILLLAITHLTVMAKKHNVIFIVGDDVGYNDIGATNGTPVLVCLPDRYLPRTDIYPHAPYTHSLRWQDHHSGPRHTHPHRRDPH